MKKTGLTGGLILLLAAAAALGAYAQTLSFGLVWDDPALIAQVDRTVEAHGIAGLLRAPFLTDPVSGASLGYYRPAVSLLVWLTSRLALFLPWAYHAVAVLLHALNSALVGLLLLRLLLPPGAALFGALLFAVHPAHTESVAFFSGLTDVLATTFVLCAALLLLRAGTARGPARLRLSALYLLSLLLACLSKEMALMFPAVPAAWCLAARGAERCRPADLWRRHRLLLLGTAAAPALALGLRLFVGGQPLLGKAPRALESIDWSALPASWVTYFRLLVAPWPLNALYDKGQLAWTAAAAFATLLLLGACAAVAGERHRRIGVLCLAWIVAFLAPVSGLLPLAGAPLADRFLYLPSVGFSLLCGYLFELGAGFLRLRRPLLLLCAALLLLGVWGTASRSRVWKDEIALFADIVRTTPRSPIGHNNYGNALMDAGRTSEALPVFLAAVRLEPNFATANYNAGVAAAALDDTVRAESFLRRATALKPAWAAPYIELGELYGRRGSWVEAEGLFRDAVRAEPQNALARKDLALARLMQGGRAAAQEDQRALSVLDPAMAAELQSWIDRVR